MMGTMAQIAVYDGSSSGIDAAFSEIKALERSLHIDHQDSSAARDNAMTLSEIYRQITVGAFDARIGAVTKAWRFDTPDPRRPSPLEIERALRAPAIWDFGGIGKGIAAARAADMLRSAGARSGLVNLGGNIQTFGVPPDGAKWRIGVVHPRQPGDAIAFLAVPTGRGVATSGDYERFTLDDHGRRLHHILDPRTGLPADRSESGARLVSVTIVATDAEVADAWSTAAFVLGWPEGFRRIEADTALEGFFVVERPDGSVETHATSGLEASGPEDNS